MKLVKQIGDVVGEGARWLRTAIGRAISGFAALFALAVFLWPRKHWEVEPDKLFAFLISLAAWLGSLMPDRPASAHDVELFSKFQAVATPDWINWLRRHDFGGSFNAERCNPHLKIDGDWEGASYSFDDPVLKAAFDPLVDQVCEFTRLIAHNTWPIRGSRMQTACPGGEPDFDAEPHVWARVQRLNHDGTALAKAIDAFILLGRRRLNQAPPAASASA